MTVSRIKSLHSFTKLLPSDSEPTDLKILYEAHSTRSQCPSTLNSIWKPSPTSTNRITGDKPPVSPHLAQSPSESTPLGNKSTAAAAASSHPNKHPRPYDIRTQWQEGKGQEPPHKWSSGQSRDRSARLLWRKQIPSHLRSTLLCPSTTKALLCLLSRQHGNRSPTSRHTDTLRLMNRNVFF